METFFKWGKHKYVDSSKIAIILIIVLITMYEAENILAEHL